MNSIGTFDRSKPIAQRRSSIRTMSCESENGTSSSLDINSTCTPPETINKGINQLSKFEIVPKSNNLTNSTKHIKLLIRNSHTSEDTRSENSREQEINLSTLIEEYQLSLNRSECDNSNCCRFKHLSYRISQTLLERINTIKNDLKLSRNETLALKNSPHELADSSKRNSNFVEKEDTEKSEKEKLFNLVIEKTKRVQDLEKLLEDQRKLRLQDANQVEEKATKIKEWVANKLRELENQNKHLRDQNKKHKATIESLTARLASQTQISSLDSVHFIDRQSYDVDDDKIETAPTKSRSQTIENLDHTTHLDLKIKYNESLTSEQYKLKNHNITEDHNNELRETQQSNLPGRSSPIYDSVSLETTNKVIRKRLEQTNGSSVEKPPPPPPMHQTDRWELDLYNLAEKNLMPLLRRDSFIDDGSLLESLESNSDNILMLRRSSCIKNELISLMKPSFTTIDGDQVVEGLDNDVCSQRSIGGFLEDDRSSQHVPGDQQSQTSSHSDKQRKFSIDFPESSDAPFTPIRKLFDSPMRSRGRQDCILRTQSFRRSPAPDKLYDFLVADLIKRGYLVKPAALKSHTRWFVLKNFHLYSYKSESEEISKAAPLMKMKLDSSCQVTMMQQSGESSFPFKVIYPDKTIQLVADTSSAREEWIRMLIVTINLSDMDPESLANQCPSFEGMMSITRHGSTKRCFATLINHVIFFLKSLTDPNPTGYLSVKGSKIREITDSHDYNSEDLTHMDEKSISQDCSLAVYPRYSTTPDPVYITLGNRIDTDKWFHFLSSASGVDQSYGTQFERTLTKLMINNSFIGVKNMTPRSIEDSDKFKCLWRENHVMSYTDKPILQPLTSLPNETLRLEAVELFKSILLFTQVPLEPIAIDYHVSLLQNCLDRFLKNPELRNEFYAQLIKQSTYIEHHLREIGYQDIFHPCKPGMCSMVTDTAITQLNVDNQPSPPPTVILQVMQIFAISVSLNLPRGRMRWWLTDHLQKFSNPITELGKYALYTLKALGRSSANGARENVPSRTEIMGILLRNPYDHSTPHSLPVSFSDGSYLVIEADGSTTVEEFMESIGKIYNVRNSSLSDFFLFADDPSDSNNVHILEPQRKVLDVVGWWEQVFRRQNSGRFQSTKVIRLSCKKRLIFRSEKDETNQERLLILHQVNQELISQRVPLDHDLAIELAAIMIQMTYGDFDKSKDRKLIDRVLEKSRSSYLPKQFSDTDEEGGQWIVTKQVLADKWQKLIGRSTQDCIKVYLNCFRRINV